MKINTFILLLIFMQHLYPQDSFVGVFKENMDVGNPKLSGAANYNNDDQSYTLKGGGYNIWGLRDEFRYVFNKIDGDFIVTANFEFEGENLNHRKIGWMIRSSVDDNAAMAGVFVHGDGLTAAQWREKKGVEMKNPENEIHAPKRFYQILQLERNGNSLTARAAQSGEPLEEIARIKLSNIPNEAMVGIALSAHDENVVETAKVWNLRIDQPVAENYNPYDQGFLGCRMETMNIFDGKRKVIYKKNNRFEAPNWMPNGEELLFNMDGDLYTIPVEGGDLKQLNTGFANKINNDHCISFDGKQLGISDDGLGGSNIYVLPITGGEPKVIIKEAPSYLHGWSADNKKLVYVAKRNNAEAFDIYQKPVNGGDEVKLTNNGVNEHADGCEYSPDGKYIYYNASKKGGTMQLWRMKPDGSEKAQITFDSYNDWFPHISPDGKWIAFISFEAGIPLNSHPSYKPVMLRLMPASGGAPKTIAYLYGGQGTINVNSWSPDSKHLAFVSNSGK